MCNFSGKIKELGAIPIELIENLTTKLENIDWHLHDALKPNKHGVFIGTTEHIVFKFPTTIDSHLSSTFYPSWNIYGELIQPIIDHIIPFYEYEKGETMSIMLANLLSGKTIAKHIDGGNAHAVPHKIHVPLITGPKVEFLEEDDSYYLKRGFAYEVNNLILHGVINGEDFNRVHLIFTYYDAA